jgi:hypothetical protein
LAPPIQGRACGALAGHKKFPVEDECLLLDLNRPKFRYWVKLPAHRAELPGKVISLYIVPLYPAYPAGSGTGRVPVNAQSGFLFSLPFSSSSSLAPPTHPEKMQRLFENPRPGKEIPQNK